MVDSETPHDIEGSSSYQDFFIFSNMSSIGENITFDLDEVSNNISTELQQNNLTSPSNGGPMLPYRLELDVSVQIGLYSIIFMLAVLGNILVILTLVQNSSMRTITNLFLLNLAISDLLVGVLCMPFTLVGIVLKDFVFGGALCKLIPYLQAVSVSVSAWTLVAIAIERYYAICYPLTSRRWQTLSHAYKVITLVWILSCLCMAPIPVVNTLQPIRDTGRHKCREDWPNNTLERVYTIFLDNLLLVFPLVIMTVKYGLITRTLWNVSGGNSGPYEHSYMLAASGTEEQTPAASPSKPRVTVTLSGSNNSQSRGSIRSSLGSFRKASFKRNTSSTSSQMSKSPSTKGKRRSLQQPQRESLLSTSGHIQIQQQHHNSPSGPFSQSQPTALLRRSNVGKSLRKKKRVIQMLGVVCLGFFLCWTPLYVMNTWYLFSPTSLYNMIGPLGVSLIHLLAYVSSCSNPITYCFMNRGFRIAFCHVFGCHCTGRRHSQAHRNGERNDSLRLTRNRSLYNSTFKASEEV